MTEGNLANLMATRRAGEAVSKVPPIRRLFARAFSLPSLLAVLSLWLVISLLLNVSGASLAPINVVSLTLLTTGCLGAAAVRVAAAPIQLWFPMPWFLLTCAGYYGFGPLLYYFGTPETVAYVDAYYPITDATLFRCNVLTLSGTIAVITAYLVLKSILPGNVARVTNSCANARLSRFLWKLALLFIAIGVPIKLFLVLPRALGLIDVVLPGSLEYLGVLSLVALVPLFLLRVNAYAHSRLVFALLLVFELTGAFMQLSKLALLKVAIVLVLAAVLRGIAARKLAVISIISFAIYAIVLVPLVGYGRIAFNVLGLTSSSEAAALAGDVVRGAVRDEVAAVLPGVQAWWARLNYANAQAFAIDAYTRGQPGETIGSAGWSFVPRFLYPDKPIATTGDVFNELVTGNPESKSAPGMFVEGYWNAGWPGLLLVTLVMGIFFVGWERYTRPRLKSLQLQYLPVMWLGLFPAIQQDAWFIPGTLGIVPIAIAFHWFARLLVAALLRNRRQHLGNRLG